jgi:cytochrome bd-type quinol oxidase subunit 1
MFTTGQLIFAICFVIAFVIVMIFAYKRDKKLHKKHYRGSLWILVGFLVFVGLLLMAKWLLKQ